MAKYTTMLEKAAIELVEMYISNRGTKYEFISCITPGPRKAGSPAWKAWDNLRKALGEDINVQT